MTRLGLVALGGAVGAVARYVLAGWAHRLLGEQFPWGTAAVNIVGCLLMGVLSTAFDDRWALSPLWQLTLGVGVLGGFTTFSAFGYESVALMRAGSINLVLVNVAINVVLGIAAVIAGRWLAQVAGL